MQLSKSKEFDVLDVLSVLSFWISLLNLDENLSQSTASDLMSEAVADIHEHLKQQDEKIEHILEVLEHEKNS